MAPQNKPTQVVNSHCGSEKKKGGPQQILIQAREGVKIVLQEIFKL